MKFIRQIERLQRLNHLIKNECTGTPDELSARLKLKKSQLYETLDLLKIYGAPVKYSRKMQTFYYERTWSLEINLKVQVLTAHEKYKIFGGNKNGFCLPSDFSGRKEFTFTDASPY